MMSRKAAAATLVLSLCATICGSGAAWAAPGYAVALGSGTWFDFGTAYADDGSRSYVSGWRYDYSGANDGFLTCLSTTGSHLWTLAFEDYQWIEDLAAANAGVVALLNDGMSPSVIYVNQTGKVVWKKQISGGANGFGWLHSIRRTPDGGYILGGWWSDYAGVNNGWLVKITSAGVAQWSKAYPLSSGSAVYGFGAVELSSDGGYLAAGSTWATTGPEDAWIMKTDANGNVLWERAIGATKWYEWGSPVQASDGGCFYVGYRYSTTNEASFVIRLDSAGKLLWAKSLQGDLYALSITLWNQRFGAPTPDGGVVLAASFLDTGTYTWDASLLKIDGAGNIAWHKSYDFGQSNELVQSVYQTTGGGIAWCGTSINNAGEWQTLVLRCDAAGELGGACQSNAGTGALSKLSVKVKTLAARAQDLPVSIANANVRSKKTKTQVQVLCRSGEVH